MLSRKKPFIVAVSGYFNPLHVGHLKMIEEAKRLGDLLVVIVNSDAQVKIKGSVPFMNNRDRMRIVKALKSVDKVVLSIDKDKTVCKTLAKIKPNIFANGGDRASAKDIPETAVCEQLGIKMVFNVGGKKSDSSSDLIKNAAENHFKKLNNHNTTIRPWGSYEVLMTGHDYKLKKFIVNPEHSLSLQLHKRRSEHWMIVSGTANVNLNNKKYILSTGQSLYIPVGAKHRIANENKIPLEIFEIQKGDYLEEDDIVRFDDKYGRA